MAEIVEVPDVVPTATPNTPSVTPVGVPVEASQAPPSRGVFCGGGGTLRHCRCYDYACGCC